MAHLPSAMPTTTGVEEEPVESSRTRGLSASEISELREIFNLVDKDGTGSISKSELGSLMAVLGVRCSAQDLDLMIKECDTDGSGEIEFSEFLFVTSRRVATPYGANQVKAAFKVFEGSAPAGFVRATDLVKALTVYADSEMRTEKPVGSGAGSRPPSASATSTGFSAERMEELIQQLEPDSAGLINYIAFVETMMDD